MGESVRFSVRNYKYLLFPHLKRTNSPSKTDIRPGAVFVPTRRTLFAQYRVGEGVVGDEIRLGQRYRLTGAGRMQNADPVSGEKGLGWLVMTGSPLVLL